MLLINTWADVSYNLESEAIEVMFFSQGTKLL